MAAYSDSTTPCPTDPLQLNEILEGNPIPTLVINPAHKITYWNRACELLTGVKAKDILGTDKHQRIFHAGKREMMADFIVRGAGPADLGRHYNGDCKKSRLIRHGYEARAFFPKLGEAGKWLFFTAAPIHDDQGNLLGAIETIQDITDQKEMIQALEDRQRELDEKNIYLEKINQALKASLDHRDIEKHAVEEDILVNIKRLIFPYLEALAACKIETKAITYVNIINTNLNDIVSRMSNRLPAKYLDLTPAEIRVADFIREGKNTKEIANILNLAPSSIKWHRLNIRRKLDLNDKKINLQTFLRSLSRP